MRAWYIPAWNGDFRLVQVKGKDQSRLIIEKPSPNEALLLDTAGKLFVEKGWLTEWKPISGKKFGWWNKRLEVVIDASVDKAGPVVAGLLRPGPAVLTALKLTNGLIVTTDQTLGEDLGLETYRHVPKPEPIQDIAEKPPKKKEPEKAITKEADSAATVRRPTPSCPQCVPGSIEPATEVLLSFLNNDEHEQWKTERAIVIRGGLSQHRYLLAHRHTPRAQKIGRMCYDLDDDTVVHFHDWRVPPEEEVLGAKLILEHREPWLRNEATMLGAGQKRDVFKNPFGGFLDGVWDANLTSAIGLLFERP